MVPVEMTLTQKHFHLISSSLNYLSNNCASRKHYLSKLKQVKLGVVQVKMSLTLRTFCIFYSIFPLTLSRSTLAYLRRHQLSKLDRASNGDRYHSLMIAFLVEICRKRQSQHSLDDQGNVARLQLVTCKDRLL